MALPVKNSCKPGILVTFSAPRPAADLVRCLELKEDVGFIGVGGSYPHHHPVRVSHHITAPFPGATMSPAQMGEFLHAKTWRKKELHWRGEHSPPSCGYSGEDHGAYFCERARGEESLTPEWNWSDVLNVLSRLRVDPLHQNKNTWGGTRRDKGCPGWIRRIDRPLIFLLLLHSRTELSSTYPDPLSTPRDDGVVC